MRNECRADGSGSWFPLHNTSDGADISQHTHKILIVDDEEVILRLLTEALGRAGFVVRTAGSGAEAVELYVRGGIDLVLLDVRMPAPWDGPSTLRALQEVAPDVRAAFMSGHLGEYTADALLALGAMRVFDKPFRSISQLVTGLNELVPV